MTERYDAVELKPAEPEPASTEGSFLSHIQRALTNAKKQDTRVRKLAEEQQKRRQQFAQYEADVKAKFATQKKNFLADMERLAAEQAAAVEAGQTAAAQVKALVAGKAPTPAAPAITEREAAWKELWASVQDEPRPTGFLREALSAAGMSEEADSEMQDVLGPSFPQARGLEVVPGAEAFFGTPPGLVRAERARIHGRGAARPLYAVTYASTTGCISGFATGGHQISKQAKAPPLCRFWRSERRGTSGGAIARPPGSPWQAKAGR